MTADVLLHWMTHMGEGTWGGFRASVSKLAGVDADIDAICRRLRVLLSDMGYADFFVEGSQRWHILPPMLAGLTGDEGATLLIGARTPSSVGRVADAAAAHGCRIESQSINAAPSTIRIRGDADALRQMASAVDVSFVPNAAAAFCAAAPAVPVQLSQARRETGPGNWTVRSFELQSLSWIEGLQGRSACEYQSKYGPKRFFLHKRRGQLLRMGKRDAVYAAAMLNGVELASYDEDLRVLTTPVQAPLPESLARAATLCAGAPAMVGNGQIRYSKVPPDAAALILLSAGAAYPRSARLGPTTRSDQLRDGQSI